MIIFSDYQYMNLLEAFQKRLRRTLFLEKAPEVGEITLHQRRVFTLPSKAGLAFLALLIICFLTATNYNLNLGFAMTYLLAGMALVNTVFTFRNLAYLKLSARGGSPIFAGDQAEFVFKIQNTHALERFAIHVAFQKSPNLEHLVDLHAHEVSSFKLNYPSTTRGVLRCPRVQLQTWFPLGLLRAWSTWLPDAQVLVYPIPEINSPELPFIGDSNQTGQSNSGQEDYSGVRSYQSGDPLKHLSWKHIARIDLDAGGNLVSKQFSGTSTGALSIDFGSLSPFLDLELRLSRMTSWILEADRLGLPYEFKLDKLHFPSATGESHRQACLSALAMYGLSNLQGGDT